ncbi:MAG: hypothetical protein JRJ84_08220 [Deltaproteobacteria bacterium]|nr:hypothetical protein [Deltaproteobacteria bacterium]
MTPQTPREQLRAKDLLKNEEIAIRKVLGHKTVAGLTHRAWRRPAGCSARLYKRMSTDDPFEPPPELAPKKDHRPVYVSGRFVRLDASAKGIVESLPGGGEKVPKWEDKPKKHKEAKPPEPTPSPQAEKAPPQRHTPDFGGKPEVPVDRRPPRIVPPKESSGSGRMHARPTRSTTVHGAPPLTEDGELDRRPPRFLGEKPQARGPSEPRRRPPPAVDKDGKPIDRRPPVVAFVPTDERGEPLRAWRDRRRARESGIPLAPLPEPVVAETRPEPPRPEEPPRSEEPARSEDPPPQEAALVSEEPVPPPEEPPPPPKPAEPSLDDLFASPPPRKLPGTGGLDDLFGGMQEGRVRIGRRKKKTALAEPEPEPEEEKPAEEIDRTPPKLDVDPSKLPK